MKQVIRLNETTLKNMIIRILNESMFEADKNKESLMTRLEKWAWAVTQGADPNHCREFNDIYNDLVNNAYCKNAVKMGFAKENKSYTQYTNTNGDVTERKPPIKVEELFTNSPDFATDILDEFFSGIDCTVRETSKSDSFKGENIYGGEIINGSRQPGLIDVILDTRNEAQFFNLLCAQIRTYAGHYYRQHYNELVMHWGKGVNRVDVMPSNNSNSSISDDDDEMGVIDDAGEEVDVIPTNPNDKMSDDENDERVTAVEMGDNGRDILASDENNYYVKMLRLTKKIIKDPEIKLYAQEKLILQTLLDINKTRVKGDRLDKMQSLTPTQQMQEVYNEISDRTGLNIDQIKKGLSAAIQKAKQSKYAKQLKEKKLRQQKLINEIVARIIKNYLY